MGQQQLPQHLPLLRLRLPQPLRRQPVQLRLLVQLQGKVLRIACFLLAVAILMAKRGATTAMVGCPQIGATPLQVTVELAAVCGVRQIEDCFKDTKMFEMCLKFRVLYDELDLRVYLFFVLSSNCVLMLSGFARHRVLFFLFELYFILSSLWK